MKAGDLLFVYGTLRIGERMDIVETFGVEYLGEACVPGEIHAVASYPGFVDSADSGSIVRGDVVRLTDESIIPKLDSYEGYPFLYTREEKETVDGRTVWVYVYNQPLPENRLIVGGDWKQR